MRTHFVAECDTLWPHKLCEYRVDLTINHKNALFTMRLHSALSKEGLSLFSYFKKHKNETSSMFTSMEINCYVYTCY